MRPWDCDPKLYKIFQAFFTIIPLKYITLWLPYFDVHTNVRLLANTFTDREFQMSREFSRM